MKLCGIVSRPELNGQRVEVLVAPPEGRVAVRLESGECILVKRTNLGMDSFEEILYLRELALTAPMGCQATSEHVTRRLGLSGTDFVEMEIQIASLECHLSSPPSLSSLPEQLAPGEAIYVAILNVGNRETTFEHRFVLVATCGGSCFRIQSFRSNVGEFPPECRLVSYPNMTEQLRRLCSGFDKDTYEEIVGHKLPNLQRAYEGCRPVIVARRWRTTAVWNGDGRNKGRGA